MAKPTFRLPLKGGTEHLDMPYHPVMYTRGIRTLKLALHREHIKHRRGREWVLSDPVSGYRVCVVRTLYKGVPIASYDLPLARAREHAIADLDLLIDRVGIDKFFEVLDRARGLTHA